MAGEQTPEDHARTAREEAAALVTGLTQVGASVSVAVMETEIDTKKLLSAAFHLFMAFDLIEHILVVHCDVEQQQFDDYLEGMAAEVDEHLERIEHEGVEEVTHTHNEDADDPMGEARRRNARNN